MADTKTSAMTLSSSVVGDTDYIEFVQDDGTPDNLRALAKDITGGMTAMSVGSTALYHWRVAASSVSYKKIASLVATATAQGHIKFRVHLDGTVGNFHSYFDVVIGNRTTLTQRITNINGDTASLASGGIRTYIQGGGSALDVYFYDVGTGYYGVTIEMLEGGYDTANKIIPPHSVTSSGATPAGTLSLDTTIAPYSNGVPDGNEDWIVLTLAASYAGVCRYRRHANGLVEVQAELTALGTTSDGTAIVTTALPVGYRSVTYNQNIMLTGTITGGACGRIKIDTAGTIKIYSYDTATANWGFTTTYMAEA